LAISLRHSRKAMFSRCAISLADMVFSHSGRLGILRLWYYPPRPIFFEFANSEPSRKLLMNAPVVTVSDESSAIAYGIGLPVNSLGLDVITY